MQFNWLYEKGAFILHPDETFSVDFTKVFRFFLVFIFPTYLYFVYLFFFTVINANSQTFISVFLKNKKVEDAVESLSREILTIQAKGDKAAASLLLQKYSQLTQPLEIALRKLESVQVCSLKILHVTPRTLIQQKLSP